MCLLLSIKLISQKINCDSIPWTKDFRLKWSDFKGKADTTSAFGAVSRNGIGYRLTRLGDTVQIKVNCFFSPCISWTRSTPTDTIGLLHEQGHFNIAQYFKRLFVQRLLEAKLSRDSVVKQVKNIYLSIVRERDFADKTYDKETDFSRNKLMQYRSLNKIDKKIEQLGKFDKDDVKLILKS
jgi:hypothetical protein